MLAIVTVGWCHLPWPRARRMLDAGGCSTSRLLPPLLQGEVGQTLAALEQRMNALDRDLAARDEEAAQLQVTSPLCPQTNVEAHDACHSWRGWQACRVSCGDHHPGLLELAAEQWLPKRGRRC